MHFKWFKIQSSSLATHRNFHLIIFGLILIFLQNIRAQTIKIEYQQKFENIAVEFNQQYDLLIADSLSIYVQKKSSGYNGIKGSDNNEILLFKTNGVDNKNYYINYQTDFYFSEEYYGEQLVIKEKDSLVYGKWQLIDSTRTLNKYRCKLAKKKFRGRIYYAWYTDDIPTNFGPWKLVGLPGLLLKAYDEKKEFQLNAIKISRLEQTDNSILNQFNSKEHFVKQKIYSIQEFRDKLQEHRNIILNRISNTLPKGSNINSIKMDCEDCGDGLETY